MSVEPRFEVIFFQYTHNYLKSINTNNKISMIIVHRVLRRMKKLKLINSHERKITQNC